MLRHLTSLACTAGLMALARFAPSTDHGFAINLNGTPHPVDIGKTADFGLGAKTTQIDGTVRNRYDNGIAYVNGGHSPATLFTDPTYDAVKKKQPAEFKHADDDTVDLYEAGYVKDGDTDGGNTLIC